MRTTLPPFGFIIRPYFLQFVDIPKKVHYPPCTWHNDNSSRARTAREPETIVPMPSAGATEVFRSRAYNAHLAATAIRQ